jgi:hypothetical protein
MLSAGDLPAGWVNASSSSTTVTYSQCIANAVRTREAAAHGSAAFVVNNRYLLLQENIGYYPGTTAATNYSAAVAALNSCGQVSFTADGATLSGTMSSDSVSPIGDQYQAYQVALSYGFHLEIVVCRKGHELLVVDYLYQYSPPSPFVQFADLAAGKLKSS